jgi:hypothetical protein
MYSASKAVGKGIKATHIRNRMFRKSRMWSERGIRRKRLRWFAHTVPITRKLVAYPKYEGHRCTRLSKSVPSSPTWGTPISMISSVIAMAKTASEKASILPVSPSCLPPAVI